MIEVSAFKELTSIHSLLVQLPVVTMAATMMNLPGSAVANRLSSSVAFGSSEVQQQQLGIVRPSANATKIVAVRASSNDEECRSSKKPQMFVALVAAGAALAVNAVPMSPAHAGLFGGDVKVERGATAPNFPGNEGTGTKVGNNASVRGAASSGTPLGEASKSGSGADVGHTVAEAAKDTGIDINVDPLKTKIGDINPLKDTLSPDASN